MWCNLNRREYLPYRTDTTWGTGMIHKKPWMGPLDKPKKDKKKIPSTTRKSFVTTPGPTGRADTVGSAMHQTVASLRHVGETSDRVHGISTEIAHPHRQYDGGGRESASGGLEGMDIPLVPGHPSLAFATSVCVTTCESPSQQSPTNYV
jgi:hypothetical protein